MTSSHSVRLLVTSRGNEFMVDIASLLAEGFRAAGAQAEVCVDGLLTNGSVSSLQLIVAPHEYFPLFLGPALGQVEATRLAAHSYLLNVEQPGSQWFELAFQYGAKSQGVFDISLDGLAEFKRRGLKAEHVSLGYSHMLQGPRIEHADRPIDVLFVGHCSPRRDRLLAEIAETLNDRCFSLILSDVSTPRRHTTPGYESGESRARLFASAKIVLNIHSEDRRYFESHRALYALANRCLLVTETSRSTAPLVNGRHFVMGSAAALGQICRQFLSDPQALSVIADEGHAFACQAFDAGRAARRILDVATGVSVQPDQCESERASSEKPSRLVFVERLATSQSLRNAGSEDWSLETNPASGSASDPAVSVIVTLHNYAQYVQACLGSVMQSYPVPGGFEILVVDDASTDHSVDCVRRLMAQSAVPIRLVLKKTNTGPADSRNVGIRLSRGSRIFMLDADNWIQPNCLSVLAAATKGSAAAAYGIIRRFDDETNEALGLLSAFAWDARRLVARPYIDAMAMFQRQALQDVGCYSTELIEHGWFGWEDYDLWLKFAAAGKECCHVPRVLSAYRVHPAAMLRRTDSTSANIASYFHQKFEWLVTEHAGLDSYFGFPLAGPSLSAPSSEDPEMVGLKRRCHDLENELAAVYASKSWRVAAPLRALYSLFLSGS